MNIRLLFICAVLLTFAQACKKNTDGLSTNGTTALLSQIVHVSGSGSEVVTFKYDSQNHLIEYSDNSSSPSDYKFTYDASDRITEYYDTRTTPASQYLPVIVSIAHYTYSYTGTGTINTNIAYTTNGIPAGNAALQTITLNDKGQISRQDYGNNQYSLYTYDAAGNELTQSDYFNLEAKPRYVFTQTYDQKKGYLSGQKGNIYALNILPFWVNNPLTQTKVDSSVSPAVTTTYTSTFEYDTNGYPTKETRITTSSRSATATTNVYTYTYITR